MILTVTLNPSVDINYKLNHFTLNNVNRVENVGKTAGGKGLNVARVLRQLGGEVAASGFLGGNLGDFIRREISEKGIKDLFVNIKGDTRNCIAIIHESQQSEILENGPTITNDEAILFLKSFPGFAQHSKVITISGSLPEGLDDDYYTKLIEISHQFEKPVLLDTKGSLLKETLKGSKKPFLIKPNLQELEDLLGYQIENEEDIIEAVQEEIFSDIEWVVVTLGANGALVKNKDSLYRVKIPKVNVINPVGSGDSVIAGFAEGISQGLEEEELIRFGLTMGILNALEEKTGSINKDKVNWCMDLISVKQIVYK